MYHTLVILHVLAAVSWIGGMLFLSLVLAPLVKNRKAAPEFMALFRSAALRFRVVVWTAIVVLLTTGPVLLARRGMMLTSPASWSSVATIKIGLVLLLLAVTALHDLVLGPQVGRASSIPPSSRTAWEKLAVSTARWLPRCSLLLSLIVIVVAVILARS
ncbi:MAG: hypothetical protein NNA21_05865 [Nitrospira sp.]|nr:hypothetical protein [Nitrospira sp.]MCP9461567.1 hypothetical protein [Nitrospira sp.]